MSLKRYAIVFVLAILGLIVVGIALAPLGVKLPTGISVWMPPMLAALNAGTKYGEQHGAAPPKAEAWRLARLMTLVAIAIHILLSVGFIAVSVPSQGWGLLAAIGPVGMIIIVLVMVAVTFLSNRFFLGLGAKTALKAKR
ncbi:MAG: ABZJ_00895 family protein [Pelagimonas sp.]|jgi:hypothetical protein|nr:ABZJ_00895 family protein [Pelagimonas sp.]